MNMKDTWKVLHKVIGNKKQYYRNPDMFIYNNEAVKDKINIVNKLNNLLECWFSNSGKHRTNK